MLVLPGDSDSTSFSDDGSPDSRLTSGQSLSVNAQVIRENSLDWYYHLLQTCTLTRGELKSEELWLQFQTLPKYERERIWTGLSKVRIHISDPRPYRDFLYDSLGRQWKRVDAAAYLRELVRDGDPIAVWLRNRLEFSTAELVLTHSFASKVYDFSRSLKDDAFFSGKDSGLEEQDVVLLKDFGSEAKPIVTKASAWAAKSAATFHEAIDCLSELEEEMVIYRFFPNELIRKRMRAHVLDQHAFDRGDSKAIEILGTARQKILSHLQTSNQIESAHEVVPYSEVESAESYFIQAADIAAGFASRILELYGLVQVASSFEYLTYNGRRIFVAEAEDEMREAHWSKI